MHTQQERLVTTKELTEYLQVHSCTIGRYRDQKKIPFTQVNARTYRYKISEVEKALGISTK